MGHGRENKPNIQGRNCVIKVSNQDSRREGGRERHISRYHLIILLMPKINEDIQNVFEGTVITWLYITIHRYRTGIISCPTKLIYPLNNFTGKAEASLSKSQYKG